MANEKRLIDAMDTVTKISKAVTPLIHTGASSVQVYNEILQVIGEAPTVDAVEVVRCKDCKKWDEIKHGYGWCCLDKTQHKFAKEEEFCSHGERREGE